ADEPEQVNRKHPLMRKANASRTGISLPPAPASPRSGNAQKTSRVKARKGEEMGLEPA
ncbi:hypothetical protein P7K49_008843, partial [Saguinus oedipus]